MKSPLDPRHLDRQKCVQELFAWEAQKNQPPKNPHAQEVVKNLAAIDELITECAPEWPLSKINPIDLAILRLAVSELAFEEPKPPKVVIDEAVELAKEFGGESGPKFVNGVLGKVLVHPKRILKLVSDSLGVKPTDLKPESNLSSDLNITDLELADLLATLEKELTINFPAAKHFATVGDLLNYIEDQKD